MRYVLLTALLVISLPTWIGCNSSSSEGQLADADASKGPSVSGPPQMPGGPPSDAAPGGPPGAMPAGDAGGPPMMGGKRGEDPTAEPGLSPADNAGVASAGAPGADAIGGLAPDGYNGPASGPINYGKMRPGGTGEPDGGAIAGPPLAGRNRSDLGLAGADGAPGLDGGVDIGVGPGGGQAAPVPTTFDGLANRAFQLGREGDAMQYLYAWALTSDAGAAEILAAYQWVPELKRPSLAVRFGLGINLTAPPNFSGDMLPIGSQQNLVTKRGRDEGGGGARPAAGGGRAGGVAAGEGGAYGGFASGGGSGDYQFITKYAGDFGQKVMEEFQTRLSGGNFGKVLKDAPPVGGGGGGGDFAGGGIGAPGLDGGAGGLAEGAPGAFRGGAPGGGRGRSGMVGGAGQRNAAGDAEAAGQFGNVTRGVTLLGVGQPKELVAKAKAEDVDVLVVLKVKITTTKGGFTENESALELYDPAKSVKPVFTGVGLTNIKVQLARQQNKDDLVDREVKKLFDYIDQNLSVTGLPEGLTPEVVKTKRVDVLAAGTYDNPLPVLAEIRFYQRIKLLSDVDTVAAFGKILRNEADAKTLLEGKEEDRKKVINSWLPKT